MAWDDEARSAYGADQSVPTTRAAFLVSRDIDFIPTEPFGVYFTEKTETSATYNPMVQFDIYVPEWAGGLYLRATIEVKVDAGTGDWRLYKVGGSDGDAVTGIVGTSYADSEGRLLIEAADADSEVQFGVKGQVDNPNTFFAQNSTDRITFRFETS